MRTQFLLRMKKIIGLFWMLLSVLVYSCDDDNGSFGPGDSMKIDKTQAEVDADGGTLTFKCSNYNWWVSTVDVFENGIKREIGGTGFQFENDENEWFIITFPGEDRKTLQLELKPNPDSAERKLIVCMQCRNTFGYLNITQKGK